MATLREIQLTELENLDYLDQICRENNLKYFLVAGTMLGAVRHKGFIPWDDDIDVYMPLADFRKLKRVFRNNGFFLQSPETDIQMPFVIYKIRKNGTKMIEPGTEKLNIHQGIWIDIITYVKAGNGVISKKFQYFLRCALQTYRCRYRYLTKGNRRPVHYLLSKLPRRIQLKIDEVIEKTIELLGSKTSNQYFIISVDNNLLLPSKYLDDLSLYEFEGKSFYGVRDYDGYLKHCYGENYMTPRQWSHIEDYSHVEI